MFLYFLMVVIIPSVFLRPGPVLISFAGALCFWLMSAKSDRGVLKAAKWYLILIILMTIGNPLMNHNGKTVLLVINDMPFTAEAVIYGMTAGVEVVSVIMWFSCFSRFMTSDRLFYVFGFASPKLALMLSMTFRFVPMLTDRYGKVKAVVRAQGGFREDDLWDFVKMNLTVFSMVVTWGLENGVVTSDSMAARGYAQNKRTRATLYRFRSVDALRLALIAVLFLTSLALLAISRKFEFYPQITFDMGTKECLAYIAYLCLCFAPPATMLVGQAVYKRKTGNIG